MYGVWENYYQSTIFSSDNKAFDFFRLVCLIGTFLAFPTIYIKIGIGITTLFIFFIGLLAFIFFKYINNDIDSAIKSFVLIIFIMLIFFVFIILADALKLLYIVCTFCFLVVQDWAYRIGHRIFNNNYFNNYIEHNVFDQFKISSFLNLIGYFAMFLLSIWYAYYNFDNNIYENLRDQKISIINNETIIEQIITNEFTLKMEIVNWLNGKKQAITAFQKLFGRLGIIFIFFGIFGFFIPLLNKSK